MSYITTDTLTENVQVISEKIYDFSEKNEPEAYKFPIDLFPDWLQTVINDHSDSYRTPREIWATAFLSGISAALGKKVKLITGNYSNYPQIWVMVVGQSGSGKSDAFRVAFRRLSEIDTQRFSDYQTKYREWQETKEGNAPQWEQICISDTTPEAMYSVLAYSGNGITLYRDELSGWFSDFGRYAKSGEIGHYLSIFDNKAFSINRKGERPTLITDPFLSICGTIQPGVLDDVLSKNNAEASGFAQRFLYLYPDFPARKYRKDVKRPDITPYNNMIDSIMALDDETREATLSEEAEKEYELFFNEMEAERTRSDDFWAAAYSKAQIQVLRLSIIIKIARLPEVDSPFVEVDDVKCAIGMMRYFIHSLKKIKSENSQTIKKSDIIRAAYAENPNINRSELARTLNVSQPYVSKIIKLNN